MHPLGQPDNGCHMPTCYCRCKPCDLVGEIVAQVLWTPPLILHGVVVSHDLEAMLQMWENLFVNANEEE
jgi:hypothetical protein